MVPKTATRTPRVQRTPAAILAHAYLVLVVLFAVVATAQALRVRQIVPVRDDWRILADLFASPSVAQWLWTDQNGHHVPGTLLLMYLDYHWLDGHMLLPVAGSVFCTCASVVALVLTFGADPRAHAFARATLGLTVFILFWASAQYDLTWDIQHANVMSATWVIVALALLVREVRRRPHPALRLPAFALAAGLGATFSYGTGLSVWPALVATALLLRVPLRIIGGMTVIAAVGLSLYVKGLAHDPLGQHVAGLIRDHPLGIPGMVAAYVGAPIARVFMSLGEPSPVVLYRTSIGIGCAAIAAGMVRGVTLAGRREGIRPSQALGCGLMVASAAAAVMVGVTRYPWQMSAVDIRFATWSALFWVGLVCTLPAPATNRDAGWASVAAVALVILGSASMLPALAKEQRRRAVEFDQAIMAANLHLLGIQWDLVSGGTAFAPSPERTYRVVERLDADGRAMFADAHAVVPGALLENRFVIAPGLPCRGGPLWQHDFLARTGPALQIAGWTSEPGNAPAPAAVITDDWGVIRGIGTYVHRLEPLLPLERLPSVEHGWLGAIVGYDARATYHVHAVRADRRSTCKIAVLGPRAPRAPR